MVAASFRVSDPRESKMESMSCDLVTEVRHHHFYGIFIGHTGHPVAMYKQEYQM